GRAKGMGEWSVILRHALRNGAIPIVTALGLELGNLLGGAVITESVFAYPGVGRLAVEAVVNKDVPLIQAVVFAVATALLVLNLAIDLVYVALDPRVPLARDGGIRPPPGAALPPGGGACPHPPADVAAHPGLPRLGRRPVRRRRGPPGRRLCPGSRPPGPGRPQRPGAPGPLHSARHPDRGRRPRGAGHRPARPRRAEPRHPQREDLRPHRAGGG